MESAKHTDRNAAIIFASGALTTIGAFSYFLTKHPPKSAEGWAAHISSAVAIVGSFGFGSKPLARLITRKEKPESFVERTKQASTGEDITREAHRRYIIGY